MNFHPFEVASRSSQFQQGENYLLAFHSASDIYKAALNGASTKFKNNYCQGDCCGLYLRSSYIRLEAEVLFALNTIGLEYK